MFLREEMDLETEVCADSSSALVYVPYKTPFSPDSLHSCSKLSSEIASYTEENQLNQIAQFLARYFNFSFDFTTLFMLPGRSTWRPPSASSLSLAPPPPGAGPGWPPQTPLWKGSVPWLVA